MQEQTSLELSVRNYDFENDQHVFAIDRLVHELKIPAEEVNRSYREILEELKNHESAKTFLPALVSLGVKERLTGFC
jgi:hypothetical protein